MSVNSPFSSADVRREESTCSGALSFASVPKIDKNYLSCVKEVVPATFSTPQILDGSTRLTFNLLGNPSSFINSSSLAFVTRWRLVNKDGSKIGRDVEATAINGFGATMISRLEYYTHGR